ncbi:MAG: TetR family transcriptional regulator C-terminal domain-containing protein [Myxococcales bacterium]|nr:TetR family transcriptional regulator C-terminal domain-containing protein [Myxococcales bacterium]MDH5566593.1 TetR family transcriptional regulator C-terminal domain-containing protein [Myxococcales bacterium]
MPFQLLAAVHPREPQSRLQMLRRGELLDAAVAVIGEKGLSGLTLARVAARVGMSAASVNFHFDSKINLLRDTLHAVVQEFHNTITTVIASHPADPLEALEAIVAAQFEPPLFDHGKAVVWYAFTAESSQRSEYRDLSVPRYERYRAQVAALFQQLSDAGRLYPRLDVATLSTTFVGLLDSLWFDFMLDPEAFDRPRAVATALHLLRALVDVERSERGET